MDAFPHGWWYRAPIGTPDPTSDARDGVFIGAWPERWDLAAVDLGARLRIDAAGLSTLLLLEGEQSSRLASHLGEHGSALGFESGDFTIRAVFRNVRPPDYARNTEFLELPVLPLPWAGQGSAFNIYTTRTATIRDALAQSDARSE